MVNNGKDNLAVPNESFMLTLSINNFQEILQPKYFRLCINTYHINTFLKHTYYVITISDPINKNMGTVFVNDWGYTSG